MKLVLPEIMSARDALRSLFPDSSRRTIDHWVKGGRFFLDGVLLKKSDQLLEKGQILESKESFQTKYAFRLPIVYEDRSLIIIDKPVNLLSVPLDGPSTHPNALQMLRDHYHTSQIFAVHRIDREASGLLIFARGKESEEKFDALFEKHDLERIYFAVLQGRLPQDSGTWKSFLKERPNFDVTVVQGSDGKEAITHFNVLKRSAKYTYARFRLETGRKHQIRVHSQYAGYPILGDVRYGSTENPIRRLCLHAAQISFVHPFTHQKLSFSSPLPFCFKKLGAIDSLFFS